MRSFISRFNRAVPPLVVSLLATAAGTWALCIAYTLFLNPEVRFYKFAAHQKLRWAQKLSAEHGSKIVVYGASSCAFSIDGERMLAEHQLPVVNFGMHGGMEPLFLTAFAAETALPGDTLIVAIEPVLLQEPFESPDLAAQMAMALGKPRLIHASQLTGRPVPWMSALISLRPGAYHVFTILGKLVLGKPLYRYQPSDVRPSGWQQTEERREVPDAVFPDRGICSDARQLLLDLKQWAAANNITVLYSLPWAYAHPEMAPALQFQNARFLREMALFFPILKDPSLGIVTNRDFFADTEWHLTEPGARLRTDSLAHQLKQQSFWSLEELEARLQAKPRSLILQTPR